MINDGIPVIYNFDVYTESVNRCRRDNVYDRKVNLTFAAFMNCKIEPYAPQNGSYGFAFASKLDSDTDVQRWLVTGRQISTTRVIEIEAADMLGYYDSTDARTFTIKSMQLSSLQPGTLDEGTLLALQIMLECTYLVRKFTSGV
jgi:hypothetical protein